MVELNGEAWKTPEGGTERRDVITFEKDVEVTAVGTTKDLAIIPLGGARQQSVANQVIAPSSTEFAGLNPTLQAATGTAIMGYLGGGLTDGSGGTGTTVLPGYSPVELAVAALSGTPIALSGASDPTFQPPGTERIAGNQIAVIDPGVFLAAVDQVRALPGGLLEFQADALEVPTDVVRDNTEPQDIELRFRPAPGQSAAIRSEGNVFLAAHLVGKGGAVVAGGKIDAVGLGVDLEASQGEREGVSLYSKKGINISTFDRKRNKFWDASIKGVVFTRGNLNMRLGEVVSPGSTSEPAWGRFDLRGAIVALGEARGQVGLPTEISSHGGGEQQDADGLTGEGESGGAAWDPTSHQRSQGNVRMVAGGVRLFYEPKFLAPHLGEMVSLPIFAPLSIAER